MYNHEEIEKKWQKYWEESSTFKVENNFSKPKYYVLDMFPYPSGAGLHVGHPEGFTANDIVARYKHAKGYNVLHPMGWDAFGLPAENYAIKTGTHPRKTTDENIATFKRQLKSLGFSYDWNREIDTTDPKYFQWTQWIFLKLFEQGLAYEQDLPINYCPSCKTGLANEEVLGDFSCERCGEQVEKKKIRQWVLGITKYADRLLKDVDDLDWPEGIKDMQRNWIGKSEGCEFEMKVVESSVGNAGLRSLQEIGLIRVYTTRVDTVFGMTYAVIAPDHPDVEKFISEEKKSECKSYIKKAGQQSDQDRTAEGKEKTGVFTGNYVINPYNGEEVPLWIADYVLGNYGTGAVMAVPAHDERDFEFAKKYDLEIKQVVSKVFSDYPLKDGKEKVERDMVVAIVINPNTDKYLCLDWKQMNWKSFIMGGTDGEDSVIAARREVYEETGYKNLKFIASLGKARCEYYAPHKDVNRIGNTEFMYFELIDDENDQISEKEKDKHNVEWVNANDVVSYISSVSHLYFYSGVLDIADTGYGVLVNSGDFNGMTSQEAKEKFAQIAEEKGFGHKKVNYKLRDWLFSRQRYWGEPIPLIHLEKEDIEKLPASPNSDAWVKDGDTLMIGEKEFSKIHDGIYTKIVCDYNLPLELPEVEAYEPAGDGNSPLVNVPEFVNVKLAENLSGKRETNTMPQWGGSCWYYLRFMDPHNSEKLVDPEVEKYWGQVDSYVGGAEHAVLHLLYARFWHKFLYDIGVVSTDEPFYRLRNQGLILGMSYRNAKGKLIPDDMIREEAGKYFDTETGEELEKVPAKMSKSLKNVINPDDIVREYGADTLRMYEMYMADFKDAAPWDTRSIVGSRRFLDKVYNLFIEGKEKYAPSDDEAMKTIHKAIKKISEDIENYKFNTAIAQLMIVMNVGEPQDSQKRAEWREIFVKLLHPFAPHMAEEVWEKLSEKRRSVFDTPWPEYDESLTVDNEITIGVQVLGKLRGEIQISVDEDKDSVLEKAKSNENVMKWLEGKNVIKEIYVPGKIVNLVVR